MSRHHMRALVLKQFSNPAELDDIARPAPGPGQVLVRIEASGVNPIDLKISAGAAAHAKVQPPAVLGLDLAGVVEEVGAGVRYFKRGDEVYGLTGGVGELQGSLAEYAAVDADLLAIKPANLTMREAAALPLAVITAWEGLVDRAHVGRGHRVLIHGGAGGVGHIAIQVARAFCAEVYATVSPDKAHIVAELGATAIDYRSKSVQQYVGSHTEGVGFDIVFDTVGGATLDDSFNAVRHYGGHVISCLGWGMHALAPLSFRAATYSGVFTLLPMLNGEGRAHHGDILRQATQLAESGKLRPLLDSRHFSLESAHAAYALMQSRSHHGKLVVEIGA